MEITRAEFTISNTDVNKCPKTILPEFAFIGRSNVGKSSLINMICDKKGLALTSSKPGKTRLINHFLINDAWYLVDLPGYGYASASKTSRTQFEEIISYYIQERKNLVSVFVLIDARLKMQRIDADFMEWLTKKGIPFSMVFTKCDKVGKTVLKNNISKYEQTMLITWDEMPEYMITSAVHKTGKNEILNSIEDSIRVYYEHHRKQNPGK